MIPTFFLRFLAPLLRILPARLATVLYYRLFCKRSDELGSAFESASLKLAAHVRMRLKSGDAAHGPMAFLGIYEPELSREIWNLAHNPGGTLLDVGANYGYFSLLWCAARPDNTAVAVEASPRNLNGLRHNIDANDFCGRIELLPWAASDTEGEVCFDLGPEEQTGWGGITQDKSDHLVRVQCHRLDEQLRERTFTVLKIDCEGADALVIKGSEGLLAAGSIGHLFFEENISRMGELGLCSGASQRTLENHGFRVEMLGRPDSNEYHAWKDMD